MEKNTFNFTVAECGEYHNLGKFYKDIRTLEEAVNIYRQILPERMNGSPSIGINLHVRGMERMEDIQAVIKEIIEQFPEKEVIDY